MDKLTTHTLPDGREILIVELPDDYFDFVIDKLSDNDPDDYLYLTDDHHWFKLPTGVWDIVGFTHQLCGIVGLTGVGTPKQNLKNLLRSLGLDTIKRYVLIEKLK